jgi:hypothetical protein
MKSINDWLICYIIFGFEVLTVVTIKNTVLLLGLILNPEEGEGIFL